MSTQIKQVKKEHKINTSTKMDMSTDDFFGEFMTSIIYLLVHYKDEEYTPYRDYIEITGNIKYPIYDE